MFVECNCDLVDVLQLGDEVIVDHIPGVEEPGDSSLVPPANVLEALGGQVVAPGDGLEVPGPGPGVQQEHQPHVGADQPQPHAPGHYLHIGAELTYVDIGEGHSLTFRNFSHHRKSMLVGCWCLVTHGSDLTDWTDPELGDFHGSHLGSQEYLDYKLAFLLAIGMVKLLWR